MDKINWVRVVVGGTLTALVLVLLTIASTALFIGQQALRTAIQALRPSSSGIAAPLFFVFVFLVLGIFMTWSYAAMRPRFGPGPKTAALAGFAIWATAVWLALADFVLKGIAMGQPYPLPAGPMLPCVYLVMIVASTMAGASIYREQQG
jgi:hypothetical protein